MKNIMYIVVFASIFIFGCKNKEQNNDSKKDDITKTEQNENDSNTELLGEKEIITIQGNQIWVRSEPSDGEVVMKLEDGTKCTYLEKGKEETIKGVTDFWYKIEYEGQVGWVFGSQTNFKQKQTTNSIAEEEIFISEFMNDLKKDDYQSMSKYFVDGNVYELYNPGAMIYVTKKEYVEFLNSPFFTANIDDFTGKIKLDNLPKFDMEKYSYPEKGYFLTNDFQKNVLTVYSEYTPEFYEEDYLAELKKAEKNITHKFLIAYGDGVVVYFGKVNGEYKVIAIDVSTNDA